MRNFFAALLVTLFWFNNAHAYNERVLHIDHNTHDNPSSYVKAYYSVIRFEQVGDGSGRAVSHGVSFSPGKRLLPILSAELDFGGFIPHLDDDVNSSEDAKIKDEDWVFGAKLGVNIALHFPSDGPYVKYGHSCWAIEYRAANDANRASYSDFSCADQAAIGVAWRDQQSRRFLEVSMGETGELHGIFISYGLDF